MVKHVVMYKLKEEAKDKADELIGKFLSMKEKIEGLVDIMSGKDFKREGRSYDVALICTLESKEALEKYAVHPVHLPVLAYAKTIVERSHSVDFEE